MLNNDNITSAKVPMIASHPPLATRFNNAGVLKTATALAALIPMLAPK